jgi:dipeptide transport system ATP-binding protein
MSQVLSAQNLTRYYGVSRGAFKGTSILKAVDGASFTLERGKTLAVVGESGCGKSTLARLVTMIELPTSGTLNIAGHNIVGATPETLRALRPKVQLFPKPLWFPEPAPEIGHSEEPLLVNSQRPTP